MRDLRVLLSHPIATSGGVERAKKGRTVMYRISVIECCRTFYFFLDKRGVVPRRFVKGPDRRGSQVVTSSIKDHIEGEVQDPYE
jgi:hypothetical protein